MNLSDEQPISLASHIRHRAVGEEGVLVQLQNGRVIVVNEVGLYIVQQLVAPTTKHALAVSVAQQFDITPQQAESDIISFLTELDEQQALEPRE